MAEKKSYKELYLAILKIGQKRVHEGLSYNELKDILIKEGYSFDNDCIELSVKQWFFESFHHIGADSKPYKTREDLENHLDCNFILKGESCLKLISYQTSKNSWRNGIIAISLSLIAVSYSIWHNTNKDKQERKSNQVKLDSSLNAISVKIDSIESKIIKKDVGKIDPDSTNKKGN